MTLTLPRRAAARAGRCRVRVGQLSPLDPLEMDTLFDGVDFAALDRDGDGRIQIAPDSSDEETVAAYNAIRRTFQTHDHFVVQPRSSPSAEESR